MDLSYKQEITVGGLVILAIIVFLIGTTWLSGRSIGRDRGDLWHLQFRDIGNLKISSVVKVSGVTVGRVEEIELRDVGKVMVAISLDDEIVPRVDAAAEIVAIGFVGDAAIEFNPGRSPQRLRRNQVIVGTQSQGLGDRAEQLGDRADSLLIAAQAVVNQRTADELHETMNTLQSTLRAAERTMRVYGDPRRGPTAELTQTLAALRQLSQGLDSTLANPALSRMLNRADTLTGNLAVLSRQLTNTSERLDTLLAGVNRGQGTLGKFATDSGLYRDMRETSQSLKHLLDELSKHPGKIPVTVKLF